ncbi:Procollagen-lysine,2-oxoglutarate 5-dioxygenase 1, partial [Armadillidium vulgare]
MYAVNLHFPYGHLVKTNDVSSTHRHNDLWQASSNKLDWEARYLHPQRYNALNLTFVNEKACKEEVSFPLFSTRFCEELIETAENYGKWSKGTEKSNSYEDHHKNIPTERIYLKEIGFEKEWTHIFKKHIAPKIKISNHGYENKTKAISSFIVTFKPGLQSYLDSNIISSSPIVIITLSSLHLQKEKGENCFGFSPEIGWTSIFLRTNRTNFNHKNLFRVEENIYLLVSVFD